MSLMEGILVAALVAGTLAPSALGESMLDSFRGFVEQISTFLDEVFQILKSMFANVFRVAYNLMALFGVAFWLTGYNRYQGRNLIIGAVILAFASEFLMRVV